MVTNFGFDIDDDKDTTISGGFVQTMLATKEAKQICTLLDARYIGMTPDASVAHDNIMCRIFKDADNMFYAVFIDYDAVDINCMYNLRKAYMLTYKTYKEAWAAYVQQVQDLRQAMNRSNDALKAYTNDLFGECYGLYSDYFGRTGNELPLAGRKFNRVMANCYKFMYLDDRV